MAITKVINSESQQYRPVLTDTLVLDAVPTVNSFNSVTSDAVARAVAGASGEVPQVTENDNGKVLKAIYDAGGPAVEWGEVESGATYTAGDGIDIDAQNAVSVKAGNGLEIGNATSSETQTMASTRLAGDDTVKYVCDLGTLTSALLSQITNGTGGLSITTSDWFNLETRAYSGSTQVYAAICNFDDVTQVGIYHNLIYKQYVMGTVAYVSGGTTVISSDSVVTFDSADYQSSLSTLTMQEIQANPSNYHLAIIQRVPMYDDALGRTAFFSTWKVAWRSNWGEPEPTSYNTATYTGTVTIQDALNVSNPLPTSAVADAGKVLTVNNSGAAAWATPSGGSSFTLTKVGTATDYLPTSGGKELSFTSVSGQSNFIDPTKLYILKVKVSQGAGGLSFGSAPYFALTSFNTEYTATNRTHLSYAFPQIYSGDMSSTASTNTPVYFFDEVANNLHIAPTGDQENDLKIEVGGVYSSSANSHRITVDLYMVN